MLHGVQGKLNLVHSQAVLAAYEPRASMVPASLDLTASPFMWPFAKQPLYAHAMPVRGRGSLRVQRSGGVRGHVHVRTANQGRI